MDILEKVQIRDIVVPDKTHRIAKGPIVVRRRFGMGRRFALLSGADALRSSEKAGRRSVQAIVRKVTPASS